MKRIIFAFLLVCLLQSVAFAQHNETTLFCIVVQKPAWGRPYESTFDIGKLDTLPGLDFSYLFDQNNRNPNRQKKMDGAAEAMNPIRKLNGAAEAMNLLTQHGWEFVQVVGVGAENFVRFQYIFKMRVRKTENGQYIQVID